MKIALSVIGKFHTFDLARELQARRALAGIFTGYPRFKLKKENLPPHKIHTWPWLYTPYMAMTQRDRLGVGLVRQWEWLNNTGLDSHVARRLPECDVFVGLSGSALRSGQTARRRGIRYVCDRGSSHIRVQDQLLREESERWGIPFEGVDPRVIAREEAEYAEADGITVPSSFSLRSFIDQGVPASKLHLLPYGVNLELFKPTAQPDDTRFDVLYVGGMNLNKGIPYLLKAYKELTHARKSLTFAGTPSLDFIATMKRHGLWRDDIKILGHVPQSQLKDLMSRSHVLVLASVQEGLAMVQAQALACGCVVIGTDHTGAQDLFDDEQEGFIVPVRDHMAIAARLQQLADNPGLRASMSSKALTRVQRAGGWRDYGDQAMAIYQQLKRS